METLSDSPMSVTAGSVGGTHLSPSNNKRNSRSRKQHRQSAVPSDSVQSESGSNTATSPRPKITHKAKPGMGGGHGVNTPLKEQAYAGPTFQASPAASALPMPKFFSKSVPTGTTKLSLQERLAGEKSPGEHASSPEPDIVEPDVPSREAQQSPLDLFFNADRAEREKMKSASEESRRSFGNGVSQALTARTTPTAVARSGKTTFLSELDGEQGVLAQRNPSAPSPRPALGERHASSPDFNADSIRPTANDQQARNAYTKSLKDLLFSTGAEQSSTPPRQQSSQSSNTHTPQSAYFTPSPFQRPSSGPTTPQSGSDQQDLHYLHYGNRNLSPIFKAARSETPPRPSSLRQEVCCGAETTAKPAAGAPPQAWHAMPHSSQYWKAQSAFGGDPSADSRPPAPRYPVQPPGSTSCLPDPSSHAEPTAAPPGSLMSQQTPGQRDIKTMEDDLRRMLKLNVLS